VIRTARQQNIDPVELLVSAQRARESAASNLIRLPARDPPSSLAA
jgi:hypothetical protein